MTRWRPTAHCQMRNNRTSSALMKSFRLCVSVRINLYLLSRLLFKPSRNFQRSASVAIPSSRIQLKPLITTWSSGVAMHQNQCSLKSIVGKFQVCNLAPTSAKTRSTKRQVSVCGLVIQNVLFPSRSRLLFPRVADKYAILMTLEKYVKSYGESLIVRYVSLGRSPGMSTPLLFVCKLFPTIRSVLGQLRFQYVLAPFPNGGTTNSITRFRRRTSHASMVAGSNVAL